MSVFTIIIVRTRARGGEERPRPSPPCPREATTVTRGAGRQPWATGLEAPGGSTPGQIEAQWGVEASSTTNPIGSQQCSVGSSAGSLGLREWRVSLDGRCVRARLAEHVDGTDGHLGAERGVTG